MHISDGVVPVQMAVGAGAVTAALAGVLLARMDAERIPRAALCTSFFFVASLVHVPIGPTSVHLLLIGLVGVIMGPWAVLPSLFGLVLQCLLFKHGGLTSLWVNALIMGLPAYAAWAVFRLERRFRRPWATFAFGFLAGGGAVMLALGLLCATLRLSGDEFRGVAWAAVAAHLPLAVIEGLVTGFAASLIKKVEPRILEGAVHA